MIEISHLRKEYQLATPIQDLSVTINKGDVISIIGPSGTGKSTLIRCINRLETPTSGTIVVDGIDVTSPKCKLNDVRKKMGMVFQSFNLFNHLTVVENCMIGQRKLLKRSKQEAYDRAIELLKSVGLADKALSYPEELSGGQKQRVAIARTLSMDPEIVLFDEPTSALDPTMVGEVQAVIKDLAKKGLTMMIVTHEMKFAREISNRVFYMDEGGVYEDGTPEQIFENPQKEKTIRFIRQLKVFEEVIDSKTFDFIGLNSKIEEFCRKSEVSNKLTYKLESLFEELCVQLILPLLDDNFKLQVLVEYSSNNKVATMQVKYGDNIFNPLQDEEDISVLMITKTADDISYAQINEQGYTNLITLSVCDKQKGSLKGKK